MAKGWIVVRCLADGRRYLPLSNARWASELLFEVVERERVHRLRSMVTHDALSPAHAVEVATPEDYHGPFDLDAFRAAVERFFLVNYGRPRSANWPLPVVQVFEIMENED